MTRLTYSGWAIVVSHDFVVYLQRAGSGEERAAAAHQLANRLALTTSGTTSRVRSQPSAEQAQRIAKIFASRFTS